MWEQVSFTGFINVFNRRATFTYLIKTSLEEIKITFRAVVEPAWQSHPQLFSLPGDQPLMELRHG